MNVDLHQGLIGNERLKDGSRKPSANSKILMPNLRFRSARTSYGQRRFDIAVEEVPANTFFMGLVTDTPLSMVVSPEIKGNITLNLKHVTVEQVLQYVEDVYGYAYTNIPGGYEVLPNSLKTQIYTVNYLQMDRKGTSDMYLTSGEVNQMNPNGTNQNLGNISRPVGYVGNNTAQNYAGNIGKVETKSNVNFWKQLKITLESIIGTTEGRKITINPLAGVVVVRALPKELKQVEAYLDLVQNNMDRQVILEAKILEVTLNNEFQMGIDWRIFGARLNALSNFPEANILQSQFPDAFKITINWNTDFSTTIQALETQGNVQVLSSPRVATMNNQQSLIKVGSDEFFVTNVSQNPNYLTTASGAAAYPTQNVNLTPFFSGITLDVTPQIDRNGDVILHIHPSVSLVKDQNKTIDLGSQGGILNLPLANSTIRESDTVVRAKNGQVVVIGGLMQNQTEEDIAELPFFGNVPFLGTLFRATKQVNKKSELVILLKPTIINKLANNQQLNNATQRITGLKRGLHFGSRPDVFGNEGEEPIRSGPKAGYY
jgi:MSHA biogenesis protein MshL